MAKEVTLEGLFRAAVYWSNSYPKHDMEAFWLAAEEKIQQWLEIYQDQLARQNKEPPAWWPAVENILKEYGLEAMSFAADFKRASEGIEWSNEQIQMLNFLYGAGELDGVWFEQPHPTEEGKFWWRKHLRRLFDTPPQAEPKEDHCQHCKGSGEIQAFIGNGGPDGHEETRLCPHCNGTGCAQPSTPEATQKSHTQDALDAKRWRFISDRWSVAFKDGKFTSLSSVVSEECRQSINASVDRMMAGDWSDADNNTQAKS